VTDGDLLVGSARLSLEPPLDLPLVGFVRQTHDATGYGRCELETSAIALEKGGRRVVLCGVDIVGIGEPEITVLLDRIADATGADPAGILVNWNHTHLSVVGGAWGGECAGPHDPERDARIRRFADVLQDKVVSVCRLAFERLEPARPVWGVGYAELAVNRRERTADGTTILGWNPDALVDNQVTSLQFRRHDESVVATAVNYGCHPVTTGYDMYVYSADFPGPLRDVVRRVTGGEAVFLQGAGGNVLPKVAFTDNEEEAEVMGGRLAIEALHSLAGRFATPRRMVYRPERSIMQISSYRRAALETGSVELAATMREVRFPLLPLPSLEDVRAVSAEWEAKLADAVAAGSGHGGAARIAFWHAGWARKTERALLDGTAPSFREGRIHAIRIGDGVIVSGPGEVFTEIGMAVKERSPGTPTIYAGFTNGLVAYFATAAEYAHGGYEADYSCRGHGNPSHVAPECERILVETGVRAAESLFPDAVPWDEEQGWTATGELPGPLPPDALVHPDRA
jgi:neutral ceramidase